MYMKNQEWVTAMRVTKKHITKYLPVVALLVALVGTLLVSLRSVEQTVREDCLETINAANDQFAGEIRRGAARDMTQLRSLAKILGNQKDMKAFASRYMPDLTLMDGFNNYTILFPDNRLMVFKDGKFSEMPAAKRFFDQEKDKLGYTSDLFDVPQLPGEKFIYQAVPVTKHSEVVAVLTGFIKQSRLIDRFPQRVFDGQTLLYVVDGHTGQVIMSNSSNPITNIYDSNNLSENFRKTENYKKWIDSIRYGVTDYLTIDHPIYKENFLVATTTVGINSWRAIMIVPEKVAFARVNSINNIFFGLALIESLLLFVFLAYFIIRLRDKVNKDTSELRRLSTYDEITQLKNRNTYETRLRIRGKSKEDGLCIIYMDANGLRELNNTVGHKAGDDMLRCIGQAVIKSFDREHAYRIGGDEFVIFCHNSDHKEVGQKLSLMQKELLTKDYHISTGAAFATGQETVNQLVSKAEATMYTAKRAYYANQQGIANTHRMNEKLERMLRDKQDAENFLRIISPEYLGSYVVNLADDTQRTIYIPDYFSKLLQRTKGQFSQALQLYCQELVVGWDRAMFNDFIDYEEVRAQLEQGNNPSIRYRRTDGMLVVLQIFKSEGYTDKNPETIWIFSKSHMQKGDSL